MRVESRWRLSDGLAEDQGLSREGIEVGRRLLFVAVASEVVGTKRVDRDQDDVDIGSLGISRALGAASCSDERGDCDKPVESFHGQLGMNSGV